MTQKPLRVLDLFSGIGGFSLGLERSQRPDGSQGFETVAFCEIEDFPRRVLAKHWPEVPCYEDVTKLTGSILASDGITVDVITGGFPCQDISTAGKQAGISEGTRSGLWSEIVRLIGELRPQYVIVENVANLLRGPNEKRGGWFGRILGDLAECGYDAEWENIPAAAVGAPHRRERVWIVAHQRVSIRNDGETNAEYTDAYGTGSHRARKHINGSVKQIYKQECITGPMGEILADSSQLQRNGGGKHWESSERQISKFGERSGSYTLANTSKIGQQGSRKSIFTLCAEAQANRQAVGSVSGGIRSIWCAEPNVGRVANGVPNRVDRLGGLGNAIVPQIATLIGSAILGAENGI